MCLESEYSGLSHSPIMANAVSSSCFYITDGYNSGSILDNISQNLLYVLLGTKTKRKLLVVM